MSFSNTASKIAIKVAGTIASRLSRATSGRSYGRLRRSDMAGLWTLVFIATVI
ncbi:hypothetical protein [Lysobacter gummosus]|uniref:hypothetical protein n=1 Tax=Lysobacter gummosus TaxID=262324 RepID=UPI0036399B24